MDIPNFDIQKCEENLVLANTLARLAFNSGVGYVGIGSCFENLVSQNDSYELLSTRKNLGIAKFRNLDYLMQLKRNRDFQYHWIRVYYSFGPNQRVNSLIPTIIDNLSVDTKPTIRSDLETILDFVPVINVAQCIQHILTSIEELPEVIEVGSGFGTKIKDIMNYISNELAGVATINLPRFDRTFDGTGIAGTNGRYLYKSPQGIALEDQLSRLCKLKRQ